MAESTGTVIKGAPRWDLESVFPGGSKSEEYKQYRENLKNELEGLDSKMKSIKDKADQLSRGELIGLIDELQKLYQKVELVYSFAGCLSSADVKDDYAYQVYSEAQGYQSQWENLMTMLEAFILDMGNSAWENLLKDDKVKRISFYLDELRRIAKIKLPPDKEALVLDFAVNGYHAWNNCYTKMAGDSTVEFAENGKTDEISLGQLALKMASPDRDIRKKAFEKLTEAWQENADLASIMLNSQAGFRLSLYKHRGWKSPIFEPLLMGRLQEKSLEAMWEAVQSAASRFKQYIDAKRKLMGADTFCWYDQIAPVGKSSKEFTFDEASKFIIEQTKDFSKDMSEFIKHALGNNWVEAENRPGKAAGGFCTGLGEVKESRIFMTFENNYDSLLTLAHELGHAYHHHVLKDDPAFAQYYPMGLAETASTFNELLVTDAALSQVTDPQEKIMLLDQKIGNGFTMFCNIHARYIFDRSFYKERAKGTVSKDRLNEMMLDSQKIAYCNMLDENGYHPEFWASKLHFFETYVPFYNFPYTFGFLFSNAVYHRAKDEGKSFADTYRELLSDTGVMTSEDIAKKYLDADLTDPAFWKWVTDKATDDIPEFVELAEKA